MSNPDKRATEDATERPDAQPSLVAGANDFDAFRASVVDAASVSGGLWFTYLGILFYLLIAIGSVTHKDLFLQSPIRLPFMNVDLPMTGFFSLGPLLFVVVHAYVLLHFVMLAGKIEDLDRVLITQIVDQEEQAKLRRQLPANIFIQLLAGPSEVRDGLVGGCLWLIALISLVIGPVLLLMFFEVQFLPYHSGSVTWWQRIFVGIDLGLIWMFWPAIALRKSDVEPMAPKRFRIARKIQHIGTISIMLILTVGSPTLVLLVATFRGEELRGLVEVPGSDLLIDGKLNMKTLVPDSPFSSRLILPRFDAVGQANVDSAAKLEYVPQTILVKGRNLQGINLKLADLRKANLIASDFTGGDLGSADLTNAQLDLANLINVQLDYVHLAGASMKNANLTGANLNGALELTQEQLNEACGRPAVLPPGLNLDKPCRENPVAPSSNSKMTP
jgi:hypothetical protein